jgi:hypothetical protein
MAEDYQYKAVERGGLQFVTEEPNYEPDENGFLGVDPIYANNANEYDAPLGPPTEEELTFNTLGEGPDSDEKTARLVGVVPAKDERADAEVKSPPAAKKAAAKEENK